jgi:sphingolipid delta-4 desaturase
MGYHNEHHDLPSIPWNNLPKLRALAPEFYNCLKHHPSWSGLLFQFIFDKRYTLFSRIERMKKSVSSSATVRGAANSQKAMAIEAEVASV